MATLTLETKDQPDGTVRLPGMMLTPKIGGDYWMYRVVLSGGQAVVGFPKFDTVGIGFAAETDWNTNLPHTCDADVIFDHIRHNKGDESIPDEDCIAAIRMIQDAIAAAT
jgi:hypothetical protein